MFRVACECGGAVELAESQVNVVQSCPTCGREVICVSAEQLSEGAAAGDFDATLSVAAGPTRLGQIIRLGGCADLGLGKLPTNSIELPGKLVSRAHCKLVRIDFGPSRWRLEDNGSTNGVFVNGERIATHELNDGDRVRVGDYELDYSITAEPSAVVDPDLALVAPAATIRATSINRLAAAPPASHGRRW